jgi:hypothetical protein
MKHHIKKLNQHFGIGCMILLIAGIWGIFLPISAICDNSVADEIVSLNVTNRPLGEVLENLSIAAD